MNPKVSVIIPSFNHSKYVELTIRSVMAQSYKNIELIVVDDFSQDESPMILKKLESELGFKLILKDKNEGVCAALNQGISHANGDLMVMFGSDDIMPETRVEEQVAIMSTSMDIDVIAGAVERIDSEGKPLGLGLPVMLGPVTFEMMLARNLIYAPTAMIRKSVFDRFDLYDPRMVLEDYYLWLKVLKGGGQVSLYDKLWARYRVFPGQSEKKLKWYLKGATQVLDTYKNHPVAQTHLRHLTFKFLIKIALLKGPVAFNEFLMELKLMNVCDRGLLWLISMIPKPLRVKISKRYLR